MEEKRNQRIDVLRTIAITPVVLVHTVMATGGWPRAPFGLNAVNAYFCVTLFFVISGFLITDTILRRGPLSNVRPMIFYKKRALRLLPGLIMVTAAGTALWAIGVQDPKISPVQFMISVGLVFGFVANFGFIFGGLVVWLIPMWSLAVEETFYLTFPLLCRHLRTRTIVALLAACVVIGPLFRHAVGADAMFMQPGCLDAVAVGCLLAIARARYQTYFKPRLIGIAALAAGTYIFGDALLSPFWPHEYGMRPSYAILGSAILTVWASQGDASAQTPPLLRLLVSPGRLCYEIYVAHWLIALLLVHTGVFKWLAAYSNSDVAMIIAFLLIVGVGTLMSSLSEWITGERRRRLKLRHHACHVSAGKGADIVAGSGI